MAGATLTRDEVRALEVHETRVHALPGRQVRDLGDALMLVDPVDPDPFWNRVGAISWPEDARAFDRRLDETITLFATLGRLPHFWPSPLHAQPVDLAARLVSAGFDDVGGGLLMILDPARLPAGADRPTRPAVTLERIDRGSGGPRTRLADDVALVLLEAFDVGPERRTSIEAETYASLDQPEVSVCLARVDGEPAAVARRVTFDGLSYLASIGTRPGFRGRGLGAIVTAAAASDAVDVGSRLTYLGVFTENHVARRLYERLGFDPLGGPSPDLLLRE